MANPMYGQNKYDDEANLFQNYLDYLAGYQGNLTATGVSVSTAEALAAVKGGDETLAEVDAVTYVANAVNEVASIGDAVHTIGYLPAAVKGIHLAVNLSGQLDEANACTISCNNTVGTKATSGNVFAKQVIGVHGDTATSVITAGTFDTPTSENLIFTGAATNAMYGPNTQIHFYCPQDTEWLVNIFPVQLGIGTVGTLTLS